MSKTLELLARASETGTPIGKCDDCGGTGPLKEKRVKRETTFICIPCDIDESRA